MDIKSRVISLLWSGRPHEARQLIDAERQRLAAAMRELDALLPPSTQSVGLFSETEESSGSSLNRADERQLESRRVAIVDIARRLAQQEPSGEVMVPAVVDFANKAGIPLGVQKDREIQAVATILRRSSGFRKTAKNVYEYLER